MKSYIDKLLVSKVRKKLINFFIKDSSAELHMRGLVREISEEINAVRRELNNLEETGLLVSQKRGNRIYFKLNTKSPLAKPLRELFYLDDEHVAQLFDLTKDVGKVDALMIFENFFTQEYESDFDLDVLYIGDVDVSILNGVISNMEKKTGRQLKTGLFNRRDLEFQLKKYDDFLIHNLSKFKIFLIGSDQDLFKVKER